MKARLSLILALMLLVQLSACGDAGSEVAETSASDSVTTAAEVDLYADDLPEGLDYNGYDFRILTWETGNTFGDSMNGFIEIEEENGDVLNDAAYRRNQAVEERLNINIKCITGPGITALRSALSQSVLAQSDEYDYAFFHAAEGSLLGLIKEGIVLDFNSIEHIDTSKPYYNQSAIDTFTINDKLYLLAGDLTVTTTGGGQIFYNIDLWNEHQLPDPYELVRSGQWTFDKMLSIVKDTYRDLNGDSKRDADDFYGITGLPITLAYNFRSMGGESLRITESGAEFPIVSEHSISVIEKLVSSMDNTDMFLDASISNYTKNFNDGKSIILFSGNAIVMARTYSFATGVLPFPKYDEAQTTYPSFMVGGATVIPATVTDTARTGAIIEALFSEASNGFTDAYYQNYVDSKVLQDEGSLEMYKLIREQAVFDFARYLDPTNSQTVSDPLVNDCLNAHSADIMSRWESVRELYESAYEELFATIK